MIPGLEFIDEAIDHATEMSLIERALSLPAKKVGNQSRAHVRYGSAIYGMTEGVMPAWMRELGASLFPMADHCTVNIWRPGESLAAHIDRGGEAVYVLNLGERARYTFRHTDKVRYYTIPRRSVLVMTGPARHVWTHEILPAPAQRVSFVFRDS